MAYLLACAWMLGQAIAALFFIPATNVREAIHWQQITGETQ